jgi:hypothetical protein
MLSFSEYILTEEYLLAEESISSKVPGDDKGKLGELLLAKHLHPNKKLPDHFRSENEDYGGTPKEVHDRLKTKLEQEHPGAYQEIDEHAKQTAEAVKEHLKNTGHLTDDHEITGVHWTSNRDTAKKAGDHEKLTGHKDVNSNADLFISTRHKKTGEINRIGVSVKYGGQAKPNLRNAGLTDLAKQAGHKPSTYSDIQKEHEARMHKLGYTGTQAENHALWKTHKKILDKEVAAYEKEVAKGSKKKFTPKSKEAKMAYTAEQSSLEARKAMARLHEKGLGKKSDSELREMIRGTASPQTIHHHIIAHTHVHQDGSATSKIEDSNEMSDKHLSKFENLKVRKGTGVTSSIVGTYNNPGHKDHGKEKPVATQTFKSSSGPHKGAAGAFKL